MKQYKVAQDFLHGKFFKRGKVVEMPETPQTRELVQKRLLIPYDLYAHETDPREYEEVERYEEPAPATGGGVTFSDGDTEEQDPAPQSPAWLKKLTQTTKKYTSPKREKGENPVEGGSRRGRKSTKTADA